MHFVDSGGQPQFHEVLPAVIHNTALIVVVLNLNEELSPYSQMEFSVMTAPYPTAVYSVYVHIAVCSKAQ